MTAASHSTPGPRAEPSVVKPAAPQYTATFQPEAWVRDQAIPVDAEGPTEWDCTAFVDADTLLYLNGCGERRHESLTDFDGVLDNDDVFKRDPGAPAWIRDWHGPFTIRVRLQPA
jgi:hypothetical protein